MIAVVVGNQPFICHISITSSLSDDGGQLTVRAVDTYTLAKDRFEQVESARVNRHGEMPTPVQNEDRRLI
ncbi:hypothetical protein [Mycolicibacterium sp. 050158]|uniref:hypothetical protein n=1 Tax=Mycolicibacterium sp. 050158 TaxID=3090602 RepID=UPI00299CF4D2|nr:hypothetical protein [Mycolicibacterium sp. 050158]MDX1888269.1 hypothetical protein [Mycolicibacterium sp. 050158]